MSKIAWAAGLLEGEGSFTLNQAKGAIRVHCQMTDLDVLERLQELFGGSIYDGVKQQEHHKPSWIWALTSEDESAACMRKIRPFMGKRRTERIDLLLNHYRDKVVKKAELQKNLTLAGKAYLAGEGSSRVLGKKYGVSRTSVLTYARELAEV